MATATEARRRSAGDPVRARARRRSRWGALALYLSSFAAYAAFGVWLAVGHNAVEGDAASRVADAGYVIFSRDPHLGAVGFVWNPLPSLVEVPLLELRHLWPELQIRAQAGTFQSAIFMAAAVVMVRAIALDRGLPRLARWIVVAGFALNPMVFVLGGNGMSEASMMFCTLWACRHLMRWVDRRELRDLTVAGVALGVCYVTRYEALPASMSAAALVALVTTWSGRGDLRRGLCDAAHDVTLLLFPVALSVTVWALTSWMLTGDLFAQFSSQYGNSSLVRTAGTSANLASPSVILRNYVSLAPALPTVLVAAGALAVYRRTATFLVPVAILGGILAFASALQLRGMTFGFFRFYLSAVPLCVTVLACCWRPSGEPRPAGQLASRWLPTRGGVGWAAGSAALAGAVILPSFPVTWSAMLNPVIGNQFSENSVRYLLTADRSKADTQADFDAYNDDRALAAWLDAQHLPRASVLTDTFQGWPVWLASHDLAQFVVTSDYDFYKDLNAPADTGIRYILVSNPAVDASIDAVNRRYPTIWDDGAGISVREVDVIKRGGDTSWRVYRVIPAAPRPAAQGGPA